MHLCILFIYLYLQNDLDSENKKNSTEQERLKGSKIAYGESIQVKIVHSLESSLCACMHCTFPV